MFTGIIEKQGTVLLNEQTEHGNRLTIAADFEDLKTGESIAVNGVCLSLLPFETNLCFDVSPETLKSTNLGSLELQQRVNLERALLASTRLGGHYVSGHVDGCVEVESIRSLGEYQEVVLSGFDKDSLYYLMQKGSIAIEGVSLTINRVFHQSIQVMLVPHTLAHTNLHLVQAGQKLNVEFDYLARIVAHQMKLANPLPYEVAICP